MVDQTQPTVFGIQNLIDLAHQDGKKGVVFKLTESGITLNEAQQINFDQHMFQDDGSVNEAFDFATFWKETFGQRNKPKEQFNPLTSFMDGSLGDKLSEFVGNLPEQFQGMVQQVLGPILSFFGIDLNASKASKADKEDTAPLNEEFKAVASEKAPEQTPTTDADTDLIQAVRDAGVVLTPELQKQFEDAAEVIPFKDGITVEGFEVDQYVSYYNDAQAGLKNLFRDLDNQEGAALDIIKADLAKLAQDATNPENHMFHPDLYSERVPDDLVALADDLVREYGIPDEDGSTARGLAFAAYAKDQQYTADKVALETTRDDAPNGAIVLNLDPKYSGPDAGP